MSEDSNLTDFLKKQHEQVSKYGIEIPNHFDIRTENAAKEFSEAVFSEPDINVFSEITRADIPFIINALEAWGINSSLVASKMLYFQREHHRFLSSGYFIGDSYHSEMCKEIAATVFDLTTTSRYLDHRKEGTAIEDQSFEARHKFSTGTIEKISLNDTPVFSFLKTRASVLLERSLQEEGYLEEKLAIEKDYLDILSAPIEIYPNTLGLPDYTIDYDKQTPPIPEFESDKQTGRIKMKIKGVPQETHFQLNYNEYPWISKGDIRWIVGEIIGEGGMGKVYKGWDLKFGRDVAIKELSADNFMIDGYRTLFEAEAKTMARLDEIGVIRNFEKMQSSGIIRPYDFIEHDGKAYIMMEYLDECEYQTLNNQEKLTLSEITEIMRQLAVTIDDMDRRGFQHNDLKPSNIFVNRVKLSQKLDEAVKIGDFGLASAGIDLNQKGIVGTPIYMPPERMQGAKTTLQAEVYSLALIAYQIIMDKLPRHHEECSSANVMLSIVNGSYQPLKDDPERRQELLQILKSESLVDAADSIFQKAFSKDLNIRYHTAYEFTRDLNRVLSGKALQDIIPI